MLLLNEYALRCLCQHGICRQFVGVEFQHFVQMAEILLHLRHFVGVAVPVEHGGGEFFGRGIALQQFGHGFFAQQDIRQADVCHFNFVLDQPVRRLVTSTASAAVQAKSALAACKRMGSFSNCGCDR